MFSKIRTAMLALAAVAAVGAAIVTTTTEAEARFGGGGFRGGGGGMSMRMAGPRIGGMRHIGVRHVGINRHIHLRRHVHIHRHPNWCRWHGRCRVHVRWHRPWIYAAAPVAAVATYATAPVAAPRCTCLTKEYTPEGQVVFQDTCTKEVASAPQGNLTLPAPPTSTTYPAQTELQQPGQPQVR